MTYKNGLYIIATPIGNIDDITLRAINTLKKADYIICEDTRHSSKLLNYHGIVANKLISFHEHSSKATLEKIVGLCSNNLVTYISDAGTPIINDPGYDLVQQCYKQDIYVTSLPGACAAITALTLSGLPANNFAFIGFFPESEQKSKKYSRFMRILPL